MLLKDISFQTPQENILYDEVLLQLAEDDQASECLRFWESGEYFVVLGRIGKQQEDIKTVNVIADNIPVLRRASGGGTVLQGKGCLNFTLILSKQSDPHIADLRESYTMILGKIVGAFQQKGVQAKVCPVSDIALVGSDRKISGNAQKRAKKHILHHGTVLYDFDLAMIERYLTVPKEIPDYRQGRNHLDFVANVPLAADDIKDVLKNIFGIDREERLMTDHEAICLQMLSKDRKVNVDLAGQE